VSDPIAAKEKGGVPSLTHLYIPPPSIARLEGERICLSFTFVFHILGQAPSLSLSLCVCCYLLSKVEERSESLSFISLLFRS